MELRRWKEEIRGRWGREEMNELFTFYYPKFKRIR